MTNQTMTLSPAYFYNDNQRYFNLWWQGSCLLAVLLSVNILLYFLDPRVLADEALWLKPLKFELSIIIHFVTLSVLASLLSHARRNAKSWKVMTYLVVAFGLFEALYIFLQAARGRESHFNFTTNMESSMYALMGLGALIMVAGSFYLGCLLFREYRSKPDNVLILSSAYGLTVGSVLTLIVAGYLSSAPGANEINANADAIRFPLFSWYLNGQDLRIPHFLAMHMMQIIPLYGLWLSQRRLSQRNGSPYRTQMPILLATGIFSAIVLILFFLAVHLK